MEKLNLWDRFFNRYKRIIIKEGKENWSQGDNWSWSAPVQYTRSFVEYKIIDRLTGSERIEREYLN